jgi:tyrosyl-tRNA synthetase
MKLNERSQILERGVTAILPENGLIEKIKSGKPLTIKFGMDPTAPDLHLGHAVVLEKLREFQNLGHNVIVLIGDYTARIGDPSGKSKTRPSLTKEEIEHNTKTYFNQVRKILDPQKITIRYNSEWLDPLTSQDILQLLARVTLSSLIEREDFKKRLRSNKTIYLHELLYPILQGYDSVALDADVELGGTDQTFNLLMGRYLQHQFGKEPQIVMILPLLEGLDGVQKMSKSLGNAIGLNESGQHAFGKLMSISDVLMWRYFELLLHKTADEIALFQERISTGNLHPMTLKKEMAHEILSKFWSPKEADEAQRYFETIFEKKDYAKAESVTLAQTIPNPVWVVDLLKALQVISTSSEAKRLIEANAVEVDGKKVDDFTAQISHHPGTTIKVGKHRIFTIG